MKTDGSPATPQELLRADQILSQIGKDLEIDFQLRVDEMTREQAKKNLTNRKALEIVRTLVIDKGEKISGLSA